MGFEPRDPSVCRSGGIDVEPTVKIIRSSTDLGRTIAARPTGLGSSVLASSAMLASVSQAAAAPGFQRNAQFSSTFKSKL